MIRVGINGMGVIGRGLIRAIHDSVKKGEMREERIEVVAFNDLFEAKQIAPLLSHDSSLGFFDAGVKYDSNGIIVNGKRIRWFKEKDAGKIKWNEAEVDVVVESSGFYAKNPGVEGHLESKVKKVIISAPSKFAKKTIVPGVNDLDYHQENIVSCASCTTNCLAPIARALLTEFGMYNGFMTTIHSYTNDQRLIDSPHKDPYRSFAASLNIIPTTTGAAKAIGGVLPELNGRMNGVAVRVPVPLGSLIDLVISLDNKDRKVTREEVNSGIYRASMSYLSGAIEYREDPIVSSMILGNKCPSIFDSSRTQTIGNNIKVFSWYDNVTGYSNQVLKLIKLIGD